MLMVRPRGWHLAEEHLVVDERAVAAALFDVGLYVFHNARAAPSQEPGAHFFLPSLSASSEARLWNDVFAFMEEALGLPAASIKVAVSVQTPSAPSDDILHELHDRLARISAGH
jgi:malate synthase